MSASNVPPSWLLLVSPLLVLAGAVNSRWWPRLVRTLPRQSDVDTQLDKGGSP